MKSDGVHENFFTVPELPHKRMEREAVLLLQKMFLAVGLYDDPMIFTMFCLNLMAENKDLVVWVKDYKG